jgi:hypothetical protein
MQINVTIDRELPRFRRCAGRTIPTPLLSTLSAFGWAAVGAVVGAVLCVAAWSADPPPAGAEAQVLNVMIDRELRLSHPLGRGTVTVPLRNLLRGFGWLAVGAVVSLVLSFL